MVTLVGDGNVGRKRPLYNDCQNAHTPDSVLSVDAAFLLRLELPLPLARHVLLRRRRRAGGRRCRRRGRLRRCGGGRRCRRRCALLLGRAAAAAPPEQAAEEAGLDGLDEARLADGGVSEHLQLDLGDGRRGRNQLLDVLFAAGVLNRERVTRESLFAFHN